MRRLLAGVEAGGTKFICAVAQSPQDIIEQVELPTTQPRNTLERVVAFFKEAEKKHGGIKSLGLGSFGPVCLDKSRRDYGRLLNTPKPGWRGADILGSLKSGLGVPCAIETDVNAAALAEHLFGAAKDVEDFIYLTVGTGIGGGAMVNGRLVHGFNHPEMGHMLMPLEKIEPGFEGACPYHGTCLEGLASGPAMEARWGEGGRSLPGNHKAWDMEAVYLATGLVNLIYVLAPKRIILGGGVMRNQALFPIIREKVRSLVAGYLDTHLILDLESGFIVPPQLGGKAGVIGALALAKSLQD